MNAVIARLQFTVCALAIVDVEGAKCIDGLGTFRIFEAQDFRPIVLFEVKFMIREVGMPSLSQSEKSCVTSSTQRYDLS